MSTHRSHWRLRSAMATRQVGGRLGRLAPMLAAVTVTPRTTPA